MSRRESLRARATRAQLAGRTEEAIGAYERILEADPDDVGAWVNLGAALRAMRKPEASVACHRRALELRPDDTKILTNLGNALKDLDRLDEAIACHRRAVELAPSNPAVHRNLGVALRQRCASEAAVAAFERACALAPERADIRWDLALELLKLGRFEQGWPAYEARWGLPGIHAPSFREPWWNGECLRGRTIALHAEQGFGDTLLALRFIPRIKAMDARVILQVRPELRRLLSGLSCVDHLAARGEPLPAFDVHCPLMSLPGRLQMDASDLPAIPALEIPAAARHKMRRLIPRSDGRFRIGIVWSGSVSFADNRRRAAPLAHFLRLLEVSGVSLYGLQKGPPEVDSRALGASALIHDLGPWLEDFADTAAALERLDLVVMTDSAVAHLAGCLGRPVWNLLSYASYWLYQQEREDTPWYPSMRLFRQSRPGDWAGVFDRVVAQLRMLVD